MDLYVDGVEHAVLHLLYARFWHKVLYDAYRDRRGEVVEAAEVTETEEGFGCTGSRWCASSGRWVRASRTRSIPMNCTPSTARTLFRLYEMSMAPLEVSRPWETRAAVGMFRFLQRLWRNLMDKQSGALRVHEQPADDTTRLLLHRTIAGAQEDLTGLPFNTVVAKLITLNNHLTGVAADTGSPREAAEPLVLMIAPFTPHIAGAPRCTRSQGW